MELAWGTRSTLEIRTMREKRKRKMQPDMKKRTGGMEQESDVLESDADRGLEETKRSRVEHVEVGGVEDGNFDASLAKDRRNGVRGQAHKTGVLPVDDDVRRSGLFEEVENLWDVNISCRTHLGKTFAAKGGALTPAGEFRGERRNGTCPHKRTPSWSAMNVGWLVWEMKVMTFLASDLGCDPTDASTQCALACIAAP